MSHILKSIAHVQVGHPFRGRVMPDRGGAVVVLQMRDLSGGRNSNRQHSPITVDDKNISESHFIKTNDLIFRSRGKTTTAELAKPEQEQTIIAAPLLRIRVTSTNVLPEYLCWFINLPSSQAFLNSRATGTSMRMIGKAALDSLRVPVPNILRQKKIAAIAALAIKEQALIKNLMSAKARRIGQVLMRHATESERNYQQ